MLVKRRLSRRGRGKRNRQIIVLDLVVGDLSHRLSRLPVIGVDGIFGAADGREAVGCAESEVQLTAFDPARRELDVWRSVVHLEAAAGLFAGQRVFTRVRSGAG